MKQIFVSVLLSIIFTHAVGQFKVNYNPAIQPKSGMQYFSPVGNGLFVGDCIPFSHNGTYYLYWLLDSAHHAALGGYGGHQWAVSTTKDLKTWEHHPVVLGIDEPWEKSICTGSVVYNKGKFYAFYATRLTADGKVNEQLSYAISDDGIHFTKQKPNPFYTYAEGYSKRDFRDPKAIVDEQGAFHLFVSSKKDPADLPDYDGALVHMVSKDLKKWEIREPILSGQGSVPECPDYFKWNDWYYLIYSDLGDTYYLKSRKPYGPWEYPASQALIEDWSNVVKTAELNKRRIAAAWIPSRRGDVDSGGEIFGGSMVFRELVQLQDGSLGTKFPEEMIPRGGPALKPVFKNDSLTKMLSANSFAINAQNRIGSTGVHGLPGQYRITFQVEVDGPNEEFGLLLRSSEDGTKAYKLSFSGNKQIVQLHESKIFSVEGLDKTISVDIVVRRDIVDVEIDNKRCIVNRLLEQQGNSLWFFARHGNVKFKDVKITPIIE